MLLDNKSIKILEYIKNNPPANAEDIDNLICDMSVTKQYIHTLQTHNLIIGKTLKSFTTDTGIKYVYFSPYEITPDGLAQLESIEKQKYQNKLNNFHKWTNTIIAALALILSVMQLLN